MAYTLANGLAYVDEFKRRGGDIEKFAKRLSFFFYVHMDLFEEVAKFRAGRRMWAKMLSERYGVTDEKALQFRFGVVCGGSSLTAAQPMNNIVRVGIETMAAVMGGAQSIFTCAYDEAYQIPTEASAEIALRTQQIVAEESGVARTVDPLGGSYYVEWLTNQMEEKIIGIMDELDAYGGVVKAIEDGYLQAKVAGRAHERKRATDSGARPVVGVNVGAREKNDSDKGEMFSQDPETVKQVLDKHAQVLARRDQVSVDKALAALAKAAATESENVMPHLVECCHAYATVGEMVATLKEEWGEFQEPIRF
jgi:methylmalonyl-CoA mutase N-terminal domain/subunit